MLVALELAIEKALLILVQSTVGIQTQVLPLEELVAFELAIEQGTSDSGKTALGRLGVLPG